MSDENNNPEKKILENTNSINNHSVPSPPPPSQILQESEYNDNNNNNNKEEDNDNERKFSSPTKSTLLNDAKILSTKLSMDKLICKSPKNSPAHSIKMYKNNHKNYSIVNKNNIKIFTENKIIWLLGILQLIFGFLMVLFGVYVIGHKANLSQVGGGIWGGIIVIATGISGIIVASKRFCPFKAAAEKIANTIFLALCLISLAVSQLIVVISATGLARDVNQSIEFDSQIGHNAENMTTFEKLTIEMSKNHKGIIYNIALIIVASFECIIATIASYKSSREICCCFKQNNEEICQENLNMNRSHALVSSWLMGKHGTTTNMPATQVYLVAGPPSSLGRGSKMSSGLPVPIYTYPPYPVIQQSPSFVGYPLIPAPLGPIPSPLIPSLNKKPLKIQKRHKIKSKTKSRMSQEPTPIKRSKSDATLKEMEVTDEDISKTYTGLDRTIAEEFIDICEMKHASLCSDTSCNDSTCQSPCYSSSPGCQNHSDTNSHEYLVK